MRSNGERGHRLIDSYKAGDSRVAAVNSYDEVTAAYARGDLTREEYDRLSEAVLYAGKAEDQDS